MSTQQAAQQLMSCVENRIKKDAEEGTETVMQVNPNSQCIAIARVGADDQRMVFRTLSEMPHIDMGKPLHSLVICGELHPLELDAIKLHALD